MKENYCSILEYISMFELMDREYNTSLFFSKNRESDHCRLFLAQVSNYVLAACPGKSPRNICGITLNSLPYQISRRKRHCIYNNNHHMKWGHIFSSPFALAGWPTLPVCCHVEQTVYMCTKGKLGKLLVTIRGPLIGVPELCFDVPIIKENMNVRHSRCRYTFSIKCNGLENLSRQDIKWTSQKLRYICLWILTEHTFFM